MDLRQIELSFQSVTWDIRRRIPLWPMDRSLRLLEEEKKKQKKKKVKSQSRSTYVARILLSMCDQVVADHLDCHLSSSSEKSKWRRKRERRSSLFSLVSSFWRMQMNLYPSYLSIDLFSMSADERGRRDSITVDEWFSHLFIQVELNFHFWFRSSINHHHRSCQQGSEKRFSFFSPLERIWIFKSFFLIWWTFFMLSQSHSLPINISSRRENENRFSSIEKPIENMCDEEKSFLFIHIIQRCLPVKSHLLSASSFHSCSVASERRMPAIPFFADGKTMFFLPSIMPFGSIRTIWNSTRMTRPKVISMFDVELVIGWTRSSVLVSRA